MTTAQPPAPIGFDTLLSRTWALFRRNWNVALPPFIAGVVMLASGLVLLAAAAAAVIARPGRSPAAGVTGTLPLAYAVLIPIAVIVLVWAYAAMFGMADAAWQRGTATFADGWVAFRRSGAALFVSWIGIAGIGVLALILVLPTLGLALLAFPLVTMYVMPSVVAGGRGGFEAVGESFRLVRRFFGQSAVAMLVLYAIMYGIGFIGAFAMVPLELATLPSGRGGAPHMPPVPLIAFSAVAYLVMTAVTIAYGGFMALALTGLYRALVAHPGAAPAALDVVAGA